MTRFYYKIIRKNIDRLQNEIFGKTLFSEVHLANWGRSVAQAYRKFHILKTLTSNDFSCKVSSVFSIIDPDFCFYNNKDLDFFISAACAEIPQYADPEIDYLRILNYLFFKDTKSISTLSTVDGISILMESNGEAWVNAEKIARSRDYALALFILLLIKKVTE